MHKIVELIGMLGLAVGLLSLAGNSVAQGVEDSDADSEHYPEWFIDSPFLDLQEDFQTARAAGKAGLMVLFTTQGCSYCARFIEVSLGDSKISSDVQANFHSIGLEIFDDAEMITPSGEIMPVKQFADVQGAGFAPTLLFFAQDGERVLRAVGYQSPERFIELLDYVASEAYRAQSLREFVSRAEVADKPSGELATLLSDPLFMSPPYALDRSHFPASKPLVVIFERPGCRECVDFHKEVLGDEEVRATMPEFEVVRLDTSDTQTPVLTPDGDKTVPASWYEQSDFSRLPAIAFYDENGREVLKTDALIGRGRMMNSLNFVLEQAYKKGWTYQRFARTKGIERARKNKL